MDSAEFEQIFRLPFAEASAWFRDKLNIPTTKWDELAGEAHGKGFMSAGAYQADLLNELRQMTDRAIAGGMDIREFRQQFRPLVQRYGWQLQGGGPAWRSDLIWRTNINTAYQAGRWQQFETAGIDFLKYVHNDGVRNPRPNHLAMDGIILPRTDPFWQINYPPNGWGCKCRVVAATRAEYETARSEQRTRPANWQDLPDKGWDYNVATAGKEHLADAMLEKMQRLPDDIAEAWMQLIMQMGLEEWIAR
ncbi:head morphogenesis protein SPP1 gp7 [Desulfobulbus propionicus DSM 2032]|uniref:Head morphogenesis protein SPP1 gp7 n=1 Tax=Desulfobulbus propionicus (strain ATCC 33891 / DSM 2032 / VKM B-1956 / 1pr3) TaxID=577650 RepID=A0A7U4DPZ4_DESPD|nr:phage minor head protein [Desulfobulbus propionicus]ADW18579.1 head morphogenesis protein SPP1 gp7 [Desulfobulbus propionicus DSM 2032]